MTTRERQFEEIACIICEEHTDTKMIAKKGLFGWDTYVTICKACGLVYLSPRWTKAEYDHFYTKEYEEHFWFNKEAADEKEQRKIVEVWERLQPYLPDNFSSALDVGCGLGWSLKYIAEQADGTRIAGLETSDFCAEHVVNEIGAELIGRDVDTDWHLPHEAQFDLVIMRMVGEHLLTPVDAYKKVRHTLTPNGLFYIAVPNMMRPSGSLQDFWYRVVHTYYYSKTTLTRILAKSGLEPMVVNDESAELWGLFRRSDEFNDLPLPSVYHEQIRVLRRYKVRRAFRWLIKLFSPRKLSKLVPKSIKNLIPKSLKQKFRDLVYRH